MRVRAHKDFLFTPTWPCEHCVMYGPCVGTCGLMETSSILGLGTVVCGEGFVAHIKMFCKTIILIT